MSNNGIPCPRCAVAQTIASGKQTVLKQKDILPDGSWRYLDDLAIPLLREEQAVDAFTHMDFDHLVENPYALPGLRFPNEIQRQFQQLEDSRMPNNPRPLLQIEMDEDNLLQKQLENTPCGYMLVDEDYRVTYASDYLLDYLGYQNGAVVGCKCYEATRRQSAPCNICPIG